MAAAPDGVPVGPPTESRMQYVVIDMPRPPQPAYSQDDVIRHHLSNNRSLIIKGQNLEGPETFTEADIEAHKGSLAQHVEWQGE